LAEAEVGRIRAVLHTFGGAILPFAGTRQMRRAPAVAILPTARWPQWREVARHVKALWQQTAVLAILGEDSIENQSLLDDHSSELNDFVCAPVREAELRARIDRLLKLRPGNTEELGLKAFKAQHQLESLLGNSDAFERTLRKIPLLAAADATVLIAGETGTGKELVARALHYCGRRCNGPFVPFNCGALPDHLFENELFGHVPGAYTDARGEQKGLLVIANGGTLFLDEVDSLSLNGQVKLLRLLQDKEYRPLGSAQMQRADVRLLAATNVRLNELVARKLFREDLFHRINVLQISLPPLRERASDIAGLAQAFLYRYCSQLGRAVPEISAEATQCLQSYHWPGNVRELESVIQRVAILAESRIIQAKDLELPGASASCGEVMAFEQAKREALETFQRGYLTRVLSEVNGNVSRAARQAGKDRRTFQRLLRKCKVNAVDYQTQ
jgi:DNA-binding NtrC family response regulator